jgi:DNA-binding response OmpR family regulator
MANILVVEDDVDLNRAYCLTLERNGHSVSSVFNGEEALTYLETEDPDIIILDLLMPIKSGVEFLKDYRKKRRHPGVKVLVFTNFDKGPQIDEALKRGADKVVIKAWTGPQGLVQIVNNVLAQKSTPPGDTKKTA